MSTIIGSHRAQVDISESKKEHRKDESDILSDVLVRPIKSERGLVGPQIGNIVAINNEGQVMVECPGCLGGSVPAQLTSAIKNQIVQQKLMMPQKVLLVFENGRPECPIIIDCLHANFTDTFADTKSIQELEVAMNKPQNVSIDGKQISFVAREEIVLRCGKASITLTREGRVIIRGAHVVSRSTGPNKIKGGSVQIN